MALEVMTPEEAIACLDLLRALPDEWADEWSWLFGMAEDVGLRREDLAGMTFMECVLAVKQMEDFWDIPTFFDNWSLKLRSRWDGEIRAALVEGMDLPLVAQRLPVADLVSVAQDHYAVCHRTFRLQQLKPVRLWVSVPFLPLGGMELRKEIPNG